MLQGGSGWCTAAQVAQDKLPCLTAAHTCGAAPAAEAARVRSVQLQPHLATLVYHLQHSHELTICSSKRPAASARDIAAGPMAQVHRFGVEGDANGGQTLKLEADVLLLAMGSHNLAYLPRTLTPQPLGVQMLPKPTHACKKVQTFAN